MRKHKFNLKYYSIENMHAYLKNSKRLIRVTLRKDIIFVSVYN